MSTYWVKIDENSFEVTPSDLDKLDIIQVDASNFHLIQNNQSYHFRLLDFNYENRSIHMEINGRTYEMELSDEMDSLVRKLGFSLGASQQIQSIQAPMPGLILDILVEAGQEIEKGDPILILEAMKMENVLKAEGNGIVKAIGVEKGASVEKGQILIEME